MASAEARSILRARFTHPAWVLLAARRAPLVLGCLVPLFEQQLDGIPSEEAVQRLADIFAEHANSDEFDLPESDFLVVARKELRDWLKRGLVVEREGRVLPTHALQKAFQFVAGLDDGKTMTSTASRLATVQREIENLEAQLNPAPQARADHLRRRIADLQGELERVERGDFEVLPAHRAQEGIREVYQLAVSLRADFRRVEDSYREADRRLRQEFVRTDPDRGRAVDTLLDGHEQLLQTVEGQVFTGFYEQLVRETELDLMKVRLRAILANPSAAEALTRKQAAELRYLIPSLVRESQRVVEARARGERDLSTFIKGSLAGEHHRVGALLNDILDAATHIDWSSQALRRSPAPLPPVAISAPALPLVQRLRFKDAGMEDAADLNLTPAATSLDDLTDDFWAAFDSLDRQALFHQTVEKLRATGRPLTLSELAEALPPTHDLETLAYWLSLAREAGVPFTKDRELIDLPGREDGSWTRFNVPCVALQAIFLEGLPADGSG